VIQSFKMELRKKLDLSEFRSNVRQLQKEGLIPTRNRLGNKIKPSKVTPHQLVNGKPLKDYVKDKAAQDVLKGEAVTIARSRVKDTQGFPVRNQRVVVPVPSDAKVSTEKGQIKIIHTSPSGSVTRIAISRKDMRRFLFDPSKLPDLEGGNRYAFYIYGHKSNATFQTGQQLAEYMQGYGFMKGSARKKSDAFSHLEIVRLTESARPDWLARSVPKPTHSSQRKLSERQRAARRIANQPEWKKPLIRARNAAKMRRYRSRLRG